MCENIAIKRRTQSQNTIIILTETTAPSSLNPGLIGWHRTSKDDDAYIMYTKARTHLNARNLHFIRMSVMERQQNEKEKDCACARMD